MIPLINNLGKDNPGNLDPTPSKIIMRKNNPK